MVNGEGAFLEYFGQPGDPSNYEKRRAEYNDNWVRSATKAWVPLGYAHFTAASGFGQGAYDAGVQNGAYYLQAGGDTALTINSGALLSVPLTGAAPVLSIGRTVSARALYDGTANKLAVSWVTDPSASPQFAYKVEVFDNSFYSGAPVFTQSDVAPHVRSITSNMVLQVGATYYVRVTTTDIFD
jgi:hypothetical protein